MAGAAIAGTLLVIAVVLVLALSSSGGTAIHAATVVTVTNPSVPTPAPTSPNPKSSAPARPPKTSSPRDSSVGPPRLALTPYEGAQMTASVPVGWAIEESEVQKPDEVESKWIDPADQDDYLLIDERQANHLTPEQDAAPVHASTSQTPGYREIYYGSGDLAGVDSWIWVFELPEAERVDYFFERCTNSFGVLGSASAAGFRELQSTFRAVAQSVQSRCR